MADSSDILWNVDMEVNLFHAMRGHKPAGINRHFQMVSIHERLSSGVKKLTSRDVWDHLSRLYDLRALNESEVVPFPNNDVTDFEFLEGEMLDLCHKTFPRTSYINNPLPESTKISLDKTSTPKTPKPDIKHEVKSASSSTKSSTPGNPTPKTSKPLSNSTPSSKPAPLAVNPAASLPSSIGGSLVDPSPVKRTKRTRNVPSATNSPATPTEPQAKRRR